MSSFSYALGKTVLFRHGKRGYLSNPRSKIVEDLNKIPNNFFRIELPLATNILTNKVRVLEPYKGYLIINCVLHDTF